MLSLPGEAYLTEISEVADVDAIHAAREFARKQLADSLFDELNRLTKFKPKPKLLAQKSL